MLRIPTPLYAAHGGRRSVTTRSTENGAKQTTADILEQGRAFIHLPNRQLIIEGEMLMYVYEGGQKAIDRAKNWGDRLNNIARELTIRIKRDESPVFAYNLGIQKLQDIVLYLASKEEVRKDLTELNTRYRDFIWSVNNGIIDDETEKIAIEFYKDFQIATNASQTVMEIITKYSWASEDKYKKYKHCCDAWMINICVMGLINFEQRS